MSIFFRIKNDFVETIYGNRKVRYSCFGDKVERKLQEVIMDNRKLIYSIIHRFRSKDIEDLFQAGCLGLIMAYNNFKDDYNTKFTTYAYPYIVGEIYRYLNNNRNIRLSPSNIKLLNSVNKATDVLTIKFGRSPTDNELAEFLEIEPYQLREILNLQKIESFDFQNDFYPVEENNLSKDKMLDLKNAINTLDENEKQMLAARFYYNYTQDELAKIYHTNQVKISRDEKKILCKLRTKMY